MITVNSTPASHAGEDQSSPGFAAREAHWKLLAVGLANAIKAYVCDYLHEEHEDPTLCANAEHHAAVRKLFDAIKASDAAGLAQACAEMQAAACSDPVQLWSVTNEEFSACSLVDLVKANDWLRAGDYVYAGQTTHRYKLTHADVAAAAAASAPLRDTRTSDMFAAGGAA